jgi:hypothetical protein
MPLFGTLKTMALPDLLQWLATARMTGTLQLERNKVSKSIFMENGEVVGCSSDDPPERLGQFLLARGKINEELLRAALEIQERERKHLGMILVEMGALSADELTAHLEAKAEETIYSLFDWQDAVFRFQQGESDETNNFPVRLRVEEVLLRGLKRYDEMQRIREVLNDPGIVLRRTDKVLPREILSNRMARTLYEAIDGERTLADILLHVHGSEYIVTKFLYELHRTGFAEIVGIKQAPAPEPAPAGRGIETPTPARPVAPRATVAPLPTVDAPASPTEAPIKVAAPSSEHAQPRAAAAATEPHQAPLIDLIDPPADEPSQPPPLPENPPDLGGGLEPLTASTAYTLGDRLEKVRQLMSAGEIEPALDILDRLYNEYPGDESLRRMTAEAEAAFIEKAYRHYLPPAKIPTLTCTMDSLESENLSPDEFFLLSRIDGVWDLKSIVQIAPLREADCLRTLKRLRVAGIIDLQDPQ